MVIKQAKSRVKQKVADTPGSSSTISGKHADLKMRSGLNLLLLAEKRAREGWGSSTATSSPGSVPLTSAKTVSFSTMPPRADPVEQSRMSNSALLQLAEMCTSELRSTTKEKLPSACAGVPYQLNPSFVAGSALSQSHPNSTLSWHDTVPSPEKRACQWSLTKPVVSVCSSSTTSSRGEDIGHSNKSSFMHSSMSPQDLPVMKLRCTSMEQQWGLNDKYASVEKYRSASSGRKLSSSATESIPSPSSSFGDEAEEEGLSVFSSQLEQSKDHRFSPKGALDQTNVHCSFAVELNSKVVANVNTQKSLNHHKPCPHNLPSSALQPHSPQQNRSQRHHQLQHPLIASTGVMSRPLFLRETEASPAPDKQSSYILHQNFLLPMNTHQPLELHADKNVSTNSEDKCHPNFQKWREPVNSVKRTGETSFASSEPSSSSKIVSEGSSPVIKMNFTEWRQQLCNEWQPLLGKTGCECDNNPATTHSHDLKSSSTECHVSSTKTASLLSEGRLASLLSKTDSPKDKFSLGETEFHIRQGTDHKAKNVNTTCLNEARAGYSKSSDRSIPDLKLPSTSRNMDNKNQSLPDNVADPAPLNPTFAYQTPAFSKGKLKKKWTERMLVEAKQEEHLGQHQAEMKSRSHESGLTTISLDVRPNSYIDATHRNGTGTELSIPTTEGEVLNLRHLERTEGMKMFKSFETTSSCNNQTKFNLNHPPGPLKAELGQTHEQTSFNASRHPKLLFQLSQNPQFSIPDHLKLQTASGNGLIKSEQDVCWTNPHRGQHLFSFDHQHAIGGGLSIKRDAGDDKSEISAMDSNYKNTLNKIAACGKRCMDHIVEQLCKTDFSVDPQQFSKRCSETADSFPCDRSLAAATSVRSETGQEKSAGTAGLEEEACDGLVKNDLMDFSVMTASSLVEKVIRKWRDGCSVYNKVDKVRINGRHVQFDEGSNVTVSFDSSSSMPAVCHDSSQRGEVNRSFTAETDPHCLSPPAPTESCGHTNTTEHTSLIPVRKSRRANRGQKYQELIKEGVIQPSRERLAARNAEKHEKDLGDLAPEDASPLPMYSLELPNKRKTRRRVCDSETLEMAEASHMTNTDVTAFTSPAFLGSSFTKVSPSGDQGSRLKVQTLETECPTPHIALPKKDLPTQPVTGSQKRKARKHCITRISVLKDAKEAVKTLSSSPHQCPVPHKKPCIMPVDVAVAIGDSSRDKTVVGKTKEFRSDVISRKRVPAVSVPENVIVERSDSSGCL